MSIKTFFWSNQGAGTGNRKGVHGYPQDAADELTSVKNGKTAANNYFLVQPGVTDSAVYAASFVENNAGAIRAFVTSETVSITSGVSRIIIHWWLKNRAAYAHQGRVCLRLYHTANPTPAWGDLTAVSTTVFQGPVVAFSATAGELKESFFIITPDGSFSNRYLVVVFNWLVTTAGTNVNAGVKFSMNGPNGSFIEVVE